MHNCTIIQLCILTYHKHVCGISAITDSGLFWDVCGLYAEHTRTFMERNVCRLYTEHAAEITERNVCGLYAEHTAKFIEWNVCRLYAEHIEEFYSETSLSIRMKDTIILLLICIYKRE